MQAPYNFCVSNWNSKVAGVVSRKLSWDFRALSRTFVVSVERAAQKLDSCVAKVADD